MDKRVHFPVEITKEFGTKRYMIKIDGYPNCRFDLPVAGVVGDNGTPKELQQVGCRDREGERKFYFILPCDLGFAWCYESDADPTVEPVISGNPHAL